MLGPRRGVTFLLWITTPAIFGIMFVQDAAGWIVCRAIIGLSLATFVCSQVWCAQVRQDPLTTACICTPTPLPFAPFGQAPTTLASRL